MKEVQIALANIGIPVYAMAWRPTSGHPRAPDKYMVYTTMALEDEHRDDRSVSMRTYVYLNLWSKDDLTADRVAVRKAMRAAGFDLSSEIDSFEQETGLYQISWTWVFREEDTSWA